MRDRLQGLFVLETTSVDSGGRATRIKASKAYRALSIGSESGMNDGVLMR